LDRSRHPWPTASEDSHDVPARRLDLGAAGLIPAKIKLVLGNGHPGALLRSCGLIWRFLVGCRGFFRPSLRPVSASRTLELPPFELRV
jgi:hypothetical protein